MSSPDRPPKPPETYNPDLAVELLVYLAAAKKKMGTNDFLLFAPLPTKQSELKFVNQQALDEARAFAKTPVDATEMYRLLKKTLTNDDFQLFETLYDQLLLQRMRDDREGHDKQAWTALLRLSMVPPDDRQELLAKYTKKIHDKHFRKETGYTHIVRSGDGEVFKIFSMAEQSRRTLGTKKPPRALSLGMVIGYEKQVPARELDHPLHSSKTVKTPNTSPLQGTGKIIELHIPEEGPVPTQFITLRTEDESADAPTSLSYREVIFPQDR